MKKIISFAMMCMFIVSMHSTMSVYANSESESVLDKASDVGYSSLDRSKYATFDIIYRDIMTGKKLKVSPNPYHQIHVPEHSGLSVSAEDFEGYEFVYSTYLLGQDLFNEPGGRDISIPREDVLRAGSGVVFFFYKPTLIKRFTAILEYEDGRRIVTQSQISPDERMILFPGLPSDWQSYSVIDGNTGIFYESIEDGGVYTTKIRDKRYKAPARERKTIQAILSIDGEEDISTTITLDFGDQFSFPGYDDEIYEALEGSISLDYNNVEDGHTYILKVRRRVSQDSPNKNKPIDIYRMYHSGRKIHFYTRNKSEVDMLKSKSEWRYEGIAFSVSEHQGDPVYRLFNPRLGVYFYTKNQDEYKILASRGWKQEGIAYRSSGNIPVYRLYNKYVDRYIYTRNTSEYQSLSINGWRKEGIAWYAEK